MRTLLLSLIIGALLSTAAIAQDTSVPRAPQSTETFPALRKQLYHELDIYSEVFVKERDAAKKAGTLKNFRCSIQEPWQKFAPRFLAIAANDPTEPHAVDALVEGLMSTLASDEKETSELRAKAIDVLRTYLVAKPEISRALKILTVLERDGKDGNVLREIIARNPDRKIQFEVYRRMIDSRERYVGNYKSFLADTKQLKQIEKESGRPFDVYAHYPRAGQLEKEIPKLKAEINEKYGDLVAERRSIAEKTAIGKPAPEVVAEDVDGKTVDLSAFKGKVVVLDVWATWCGPCKFYIPHERALVERFKDRPFAFVSISVDQDKQTLIDFLAKETMTWPQWWVGVNSKFGDTWDIRHYPTMYVIDADGIIRARELEHHEDPMGDIEKTVDGLLKEMDKKAKKSLEALTLEYRPKYEQFANEHSKEYEIAVKAGRAKDFKFSKDYLNPAPEYCPQFLAIAEEQPDGPEAVKALEMTLSTSRQAHGRMEHNQAKAIEILRTRFATTPWIKEAIGILVVLHTPESDALLRDIIARNPDRKIQFAVYQRIINMHEAIVDGHRSIMNDPKRRKQVEERTGKPFDATSNPRYVKCEKELPALKEALREKYTDLVAEQAALAVNTTIGKPALSVAAQDLEGKTVHLSDYKGKVIVLDFWATWCIFCRKMIPEEREMVKRLKDKPFVLISVSADEKKHTVTDFLAKENMPWVHWWVGAESEFMNAWNIRGYPTLFVIDADGIIRHKDPDSVEELETVVKELLEEIKQNAKKRASR